MKHILPILLTIQMSLFVSWQARANCPLKESVTEKYVLAPLLPDLKSVIENPKVISNIDTYSDYLGNLNPYLVRIHFKLFKPFDKSKKSIMILPGGPGPFSILKLIGENFPFLSNNYNLIEMSHRGSGCSQKLFSFDQPHFTYFMRFAANDINEIRKYLYGNDSQEKLNLYGSSYGSFLAQQYAVFFPQFTGKVYLRDTEFSVKRKTASNDFESIQSMFLHFYEGQSIKEVFSGLEDDFLKQFFPLVTNLWRKGQHRRDTIPQLIQLASDGQTDAVINKLKSIQPSAIASSMADSIFCLELRDPLKFSYINSNTNDVCSIYGKSYPQEPFDFTPYLNKIKSPIVIVNGEWDLVTPSKNLQDAYKFFNDVEVVVDKRSGHGELNQQNYNCHLNILKSFFSNNWDSERGRIKDNCR